MKALFVTSNRIGDAYFRTPRTTIKEFVNLLSVLEQNPTATWTDLLPNINITPEHNPDNTLDNPNLLKPTTLAHNPAHNPAPHSTPLADTPFDPEPFGPDNDDLTTLKL